MAHFISIYVTVTVITLYDDICNLFTSSSHIIYNLVTFTNHDQSPNIINQVMSPEESEQNIREEKETELLQIEHKRKLDRDMKANIKSAQHSKKKSSLIKEYEYE